MQPGRLASPVPGGEHPLPSSWGLSPNQCLPSPPLPSGASASSQFPGKKSLFFPLSLPSFLFCNPSMVVNSYIQSIVRSYQLTPGKSLLPSPSSPLLLCSLPALLPSATSTYPAQCRQICISRVTCHSLAQKL